GWRGRGRRTRHRWRCGRAGRAAPSSGGVGWRSFLLLESSGLALGAGGEWLDATVSQDAPDVRGGERATGCDVVGGVAGAGGVYPRLEECFLVAVGGCLAGSVLLVCLVYFFQLIHAIESIETSLHRPLGSVTILSIETPDCRGNDGDHAQHPRGSRRDRPLHPHRPA